MAVFIYRFLQKYNLTLEQVNGKAFTDYGIISDWAKEGVDAITAMKLINGYLDGTFKPQNSANRAECATIISNYFEAEANQPAQQESGDANGETVQEPGTAA